MVAGRYLEGKAVTRDEQQAARWYRRAAEQGLAAAQYRLGSMYEHGWGMPADRRQARSLYEQAAARGNVNAMHNLAVLHTDASTGPRNYELAAKWFRMAAERGLKDSQYNLAVLNEQGLGLSKNPQEAVFWYSLAAVQGDREAAAKAKALEAALAPDAARQVRTRLMDWRALPAKGLSAVYFACLGMGFMLFEITMIQRLVRFLGYPTYSTVFNWGRATLGTIPFVWAGAQVWGAEGVIAGCTEIESLVGPDDVDVPYFPTTRLHAEAAARWALAGPGGS